MRTLILGMALAFAVPAVAQKTGAAGQEAIKYDPVTIEYYYRIKWGHAEEFKRLYSKNHEPLLKEMKKLGFITAMKSEEPYTHLAGGIRWDFRVTITYRDGDAAVGVGKRPGGWDDVFGQLEAKMFPDRKSFKAEEALRFGLLEDHWDVIVIGLDD
jgi:hypothetical protein